MLTNNADICNLQDQVDRSALFQIEEVEQTRGSTCSDLDASPSSSILKTFVTRMGRTGLVYENFKFVTPKINSKYFLRWSCRKKQETKCKASIKTTRDFILVESKNDHNHEPPLEETYSSSIIVELYETKSGNTGIIFEHYKFVRSHESINTITWVCQSASSYACKASILTNKDLRLLESKYASLHNHDKPLDTCPSSAIVDRYVTKSGDTGIIFEHFKFIRNHDHDSVNSITWMCSSASLNDCKASIKTTKDFKLLGILLSKSSSFHNHDRPLENGPSSLPYTCKASIQTDCNSSDYDICPSSAIVKTFKTQRGRTGLIFDHFKFVNKNKKGKDTIFWRCQNYGCKALIKTTKDFRLLESKTAPVHNHDPPQEACPSSTILETYVTNSGTTGIIFDHFKFLIKNT